MEFIVRLILALVSILPVLGVLWIIQCLHNRRARKIEAEQIPPEPKPTADIMTV